MHHQVQQGECLSSISARYGLSWQTLWNHPENAELKRKRKDPNVLYPGDTPCIPARPLREENRGTEAKHPFQKKNTLVKLRLLRSTKRKEFCDFSADRSVSNLRAEREPGAGSYYHQGNPGRP